jgi:hypothetical protein
VDRALQSLPAVEGAMFVIVPQILSGPLFAIERGALDPPSPPTIQNDMVS